MQTDIINPTRREHRARITWSDEQVKQGLPKVAQTIDPAWTEGSVPKKDEGWSLACSFEEPPSKQGNPSVATVRFLVEEAPHSFLVPGAHLTLFERATNRCAAVEILD
jgi:hypothetical protein